MENDQKLMEAIAQGDKESFALLLEKYLKSSFHFALRMTGQKPDAEDIVQEVFMKIWASPTLWQPNAKFSTWLHQILLNRCIDWQRSHTYHQALSFEESHFVTKEKSVEQFLIDEEKMQGAAKALLKLDPKVRAALVLHYYQGFSQEEVAEILHISVSSVETALFRARKELHNKLKQEDES